MDRCRTQRSPACRSMQTLGAPPFELLLRAGGAECLRACAYEAGRRDLHGVALLRFPEDYAGTTEREAPSQPQTGAGDYAETWAGWESTGPLYLKGPFRPSQVSVSPTRYGKCWKRTNYEVNKFNEKSCLDKWVHYTSLCLCGEFFSYSENGNAPEHDTIVVPPQVSG